MLRGPTGIKAMVPTLLGVHEAPRDIKLLAIETLGYIGGNKAFDLLNQIQKGKDSHLAEKAKETLKLIKARIE
jgi:hypothetical protein